MAGPAVCSAVDAATTHKEMLPDDSSNAVCAAFQASDKQSETPSAGRVAAGSPGASLGFAAGRGAEGDAPQQAVTDSKEDGSEGAVEDTAGLAEGAAAMASAPEPAPLPVEIEVQSLHTRTHCPVSPTFVTHLSTHGVWGE